MQIPPLRLGHFAEKILVKCTCCYARALFFRLPRPDGDVSGYRLVCAACARVDEWIIAPDRVVRSFGPGPMPDFGLQVWLQTPCCGETLWVYNNEHLSFLGELITSRLRERRACHNRSLASCLPQWMLASKNREEVMRGLTSLRRRLLADA